MTIEIVLTIPDNEALTALATLRRLGVDLGSLERADVWRFGVAAADVDALVETVRSIETIFNPNKHRLLVRAAAEPEPSEVWIDEPGAPGGFGAPPYRIAGRSLAGVASIERFVGWRLAGRHGKPAGTEVVERALETLLCNPAFQRARR
ncbi:MAG: hypothetical protein ABI346_10690 [Candidatus Baltobacteraceae bacterium]